jgi:hypothetical protein
LKKLVRQKIKNFMTRFLENNDVPGILNIQSLDMFSIFLRERLYGLHIYERKAQMKENRSFMLILDYLMKEIISSIKVFLALNALKKLYALMCRDIGIYIPDIHHV